MGPPGNPGRFSLSRRGSSPARSSASKPLRGKALGGADSTKASTSRGCGPLHAFINEVNVQRAKSISASDAETLVAAARQIVVVNGCRP